MNKNNHIQSHADGNNRNDRNDRNDNPNNPNINNKLLHDSNFEKFESLSSLQEIKYSKFILKHNLHNWNLIINKYTIKGNNWHITITLPYKEMNILLKENTIDNQFFNKHTTKIYLKNNDKDEMADEQTISNIFNSNKFSPMNGITYASQIFSGHTVVLEFSTSTEYLLFSTPYFYPHNKYYAINHEYLYNKILYSISNLSNFIEGYSKLFDNGIPILYIKKCTEKSDTYNIEIIITSCINITYVKTNIEKKIIYCHILLDNDKQKSSINNKISDYHTINLLIPREIRNGNCYFSFTYNVIN